MTRLPPIAIAVLLAAACSSSPSPTQTAGAGLGLLAADELEVSPPSTSIPLPGTDAPEFSAEAAPAAGPVEPVFAWTVAPVDESNRTEVASTWRPECPIAMEDLRVLGLTHWNFDGEASAGELVVHLDHVDALIEVFERLFAARFPIERMQPVDVYDGDDQASMADNNTSAFNCREIGGASGVWSQHAYGGAIDINPLVNPWVRGSAVDPPAGAVYADRTLDALGMVRAGDVVTEAFTSVGWGWGGDWSGSKDYQHFSWNGL